MTVISRFAPMIPLELLEAQESDQLVFFCGAGISYRAGLPGFADLVEGVYEELSTDKDDLEKEAIKRGFYDRALHLLEQRIPANLVRKAIIKILTLNANADLSTHEAILQLAKTKQHAYRLVTTNVDRGFDMAMPGKLVIHSAPRLAIPKPHKWQSIIHLHGIIDENADPSGECLVFTSGDFGSAYLTERWASRFITELFRHFTVLFIGYSVNDPILRYITDAMAAEKRKGDKAFLKPFAIAHSSPSAKDRENAAWEAKGVTPIFYSGNHSNLHKTLITWANDVRDGLNGKERIIRTKASKRPLTPYSNDEQRVINVLKEKTNPNHIDITGFSARIFKEIKAPIEWLPILHNEKLLSLTSTQDYLYPIANNSSCNTLKPNKITQQLWEWLLFHLENRNLINWIIERGGFLHPALKDLISRKLKSNDKPKEPYLKFWRIVTSDNLKSESFFDVNVYNAIQAIKQNNDVFSTSTFSSAIEPGFALSKPFTFDDQIEDQKNIFNTDVVIALSKTSYDELKKLLEYPKVLINQLLPITNALNKALQLWEFIGNTNNYYDRSYWDLPSIAPHQQNHRYNSWVILIELCRDLWECAWNFDRQLAISILNLWRSLKYPTFRRLVLYAYTYKPILDADSSLNYLLEDDGWWLWSSVTYREKFRLLANIWPRLTEESENMMIQTILNGPPRKMYREDMNNDEWQHLVDGSVWLLLAKLNSFGQKLNNMAELELKKLNQKYPSWKLHDNEQDEFISWIHEARWGYSVDMTKNDFYSLIIPELVNKLIEEKSQYHQGRINLLREVSKEDPKKAIEILIYLKKESIWYQQIWHASLVGLAESTDPSWMIVANLLQDANKDLFSKEAWAIAWWTRKAAKEIKAYSDDEQYFWRIADKLFEASNNIPTRDVTEFVSAAINHPIGILTEALMDRFAHCNYKAGERILDTNYLNCINTIISGNNSAFLMGRVILASRLYYFYTIDPEWSKAKLLPKFDCNTSDEAKAMWQGYLWSPGASLELASELKTMLYIALVKLKPISDNDAKQLHALFAFICLEYPGLYSPEEKRLALINIGNKGLKNIAIFFYHSFNQDDKNIYWNNRLKPFFKDVWPKGNTFIDSEISEYLALIIIQLTESFPDALETIKPLIKPFDNLSLFLEQLKLTELPEKKPIETFDLLATAFTDEYQWPNDALKIIVARLLKAQPSIKEDPRF